MINLRQRRLLYFTFQRHSLRWVSLLCHFSLFNNYTKKVNTKDVLYYIFLSIRLYYHFFKFFHFPVTINRFTSQYIVWYSRWKSIAKIGWIPLLFLGIKLYTNFININFKLTYNFYNFYFRRWFIYAIFYLHDVNQYSFVFFNKLHQGNLLKLLKFLLKKHFSF